MDILVNGEPFALELPPGATAGEALSLADEILERAGAVIVGLKVDGKRLDAEGIPAVGELPAASVGRIEIESESAAGVRGKSLTTLLELLALSRDTAALESSPDWPALASGAAELAEAFSGLFSADELSFVQGFADLVGKAADAPDAALRREIGVRAEAIAGLARERLAEIENPAEEMRKAAVLYRNQAAELGELPVLLQTGKDERAMKAILLFIETFNKVIRIIPELRRLGFDTESLRVDGQSLPEFYASFNEILRGLSKAFEDRDAVQIGDLAEYEVAPRMASFFSAVEGALERK